MSKQANPKVIGGFVVGAVALVVAGLLIFGSGKFFTERNPFVMDFEGAVNGLQVGAPVTFQGVPIGTVTDIKANFTPESFKMRIPVFIEITPESITVSGERPGSGTALKELVARGLRAQLQLQSMVTGLLFVQLDFFPDTPPAEARLDPDTGLIEVPTIPTTFQEVTETVRNALETLGKMPLEEIVTDLQETLQGISRLVNSPEVMAVARSLDKTLTDVDKLVRDVNERVGPATSSFTETMGDISKMARNVDSRIGPLVSSLENTVVAARAALEQTRETLSVVAPGSPLGYKLIKTLEEMTAAARSLRVLADYLDRHPNAVVFGKDNPGGQ